MEIYNSLLSNRMNKLRWKFYKLLVLVFYNKHKINTDYTLFQTQAKEQAKELKSNFKKNKKKVEDFWIEIQQTLLDSIINKDLKEFLRWPEITKTMWYDAKIEQFNFLKKKNRFLKDKIKLIEDGIGSPDRYPLLPHSSGNLIHHYFSLTQILNFCDMSSPEQFETVLEIGAGYGSMCRLINRLGFKKKYIHYDLPAFLILQEFFIKSTGINCDIVKNKLSTKEHSLSLISDSNMLTNIKVDCLIALWSISEMPKILRDNLLQNIQFKTLIIAFQSSFADTDNEEYFRSYANELKQSGYSVEIKSIVEMSGGFYLLAKKYS